MEEWLVEGDIGRETRVDERGGRWQYRRAGLLRLRFARRV